MRTLKARLAEYSTRLVAATLIPFLMNRGCLPVAAEEVATGTVEGRINTLNESYSFERLVVPSLTNSIGEILLGDFDGDGCSDLLNADSNGDWQMRLSPVTDSAKAPLRVNLSVTGTPRLASGDFDGDGKDEIIAMGPWQQAAIMSFNGSGTFRRTPLEPFIHTDQVDLSSIVVADIDGDTRDDFIVQNIIPRASVLATSLGTAFRFADVATPYAGELPASLLGDVDGDGSADFLYLDPDSKEVFYRKLHEPRLFRWASLYREWPWQLAVTGDFNGDGKDDSILRSNKIVGGWIAFSYGSTSMELPVLGVPAEQPLLRGDFNCDGADDLLVSPRASKNELAFYLSRISRPVAGILVRSDSGAEARTDSSGRFIFSNLAAGERRFHLEIQDTQQMPLIKNVQLHGRPRQHVRIFVAPGLLGPLPHGRRDLATLRPAAPSVCLSFNPSALSRRWGQDIGDCAVDSAVYATDDTNDDPVFAVSCCPLTDKDILISESYFATSDCGENAVVTGIAKTPANTRMLRCTKINSTRYALGPAHSGVYWGLGHSMFNTEERISRESIPPGIRFGIGRIDFLTWDSDGCIGSPPGSLLTAIKANGCKGSLYRTLYLKEQYRGFHDSSAVQMFPDCERVENVFNPLSSCFDRSAPPESRPSMRE